MRAAALLGRERSEMLRVPPPRICCAAYLLEPPVSFLYTSRIGLASSLALWLVSLSALVVGVHGWSRLAAEEAELYAAAGHELGLATTAVRATIENAVRDGQEADIAYLLDQLQRRDPSFEVFVFGDHEDLRSSSSGSAANLERARAMMNRHETVDSFRIERLPGGRLASVVPVRSDDDVLGHVVILKAATALRMHLQKQRNAVFVSIGILIVVLSVVIAAVVRLRLQRPISHLISAVRRVAAGDLSARIRRSGSDEIAELAREFDSMVDALETIRIQLSREAETRERIEAEMLRTNRLAIAGQLAATLAHEVGSPLQVLGGRARDIVKRTDLPEEIARSAKIIADQVERVHEIVERFLDVARRKAPVARDVRVEDAVAEVTELLAAQARRRGLQLEVAISKDLAIRADPAQLQQLLLNLLQNAVRAGPRGTKIRIQGEPSSIRAAPGGPARPAVALSVEDQGPGIPEADRRRVFEPFYTAWAADAEAVAGTGLGLSVVKSIVADHGGVVEAYPGAGGVGARFVALFPSPAEPRPMAKESPT
jgi:signal transduction histidine kinase